MFVYRIADRVKFQLSVSAKSMVEEIEAELFDLRQQLAELQARRRLDLDLCHVRASGMGAEIQQLKSRLEVETLEEIRDRVLRRFSPIRRRLLKKALDLFISHCCENVPLPAQVRKDNTYPPHHTRIQHCKNRCSHSSL